MTTAIMFLVFLFGEPKSIDSGNKYADILKNTADQKQARIKSITESIGESEKQLRLSKNAKIDKSKQGTIVGSDSITYTSAEQKQKGIAATEKHLAALRKIKADIQNDKLLVVTDWMVVGSPEPHVGDVGSYDLFNIHQILDGKSAIVTMYYGGEVPNGITRERERERVRIIIKDVPTAGKADGQGMNIETMIEFTGTEKLGGTTYLVAQPITVEQIKLRAKK
jgi:hypothetical protein